MALDAFFLAHCCGCSKNRNYEPGVTNSKEELNLLDFMLKFLEVKACTFSARTEPPYFHSPATDYCLKIVPWTEW